MKRFVKRVMALASVAIIIAGNMPLTAINALAKENTDDKIVVQAASEVFTEYWGTCKITYEDGVLTIGGGVAGDKWFLDGFIRRHGIIDGDIKQVDITDKVECNKEGNSFERLFVDLRNLKKINGLENIDTSNAVTLYGMFWNCGAESFDLSDWDTSNVTNMSNMFYNSKAQNIEVNNWNTSNVTDMSYMFQGCRVKNMDIHDWNTANVTDMSGMFQFCESESVNLSNWETRNVISMGSMFNKCDNLKSIDISGFTAEKLESMRRMFASCPELETVNMGNFTLEKSVNASMMFDSSKKLKNIDISKIKMKQANICASMFNECYSLHSIDLSGIYCDTTYGGSYKGCEFTELVTPLNFGDDTEKTYLDLTDAMKSGRWIDTTSGVKYDSVPQVLQPGHRYEYTEPVGDLRINASVMSKNIRLEDDDRSNNVSIIAKAAGGDGNYSYRFLVYCSGEDKLLNYTISEENIIGRFSWYNTENVGTMTFYVDVTDGTGKTVRSNLITMDSKGNIIESTKVSDIIKYNNLSYEIKTDSDNSQLLKGIKPDTDVSQMKQNLGSDIVIKNADGENVSDTEKVATGYTIELVKNGVTVDTVTAVIKGDTDGSGTIDVFDMEVIQKSILGIGDKLAEAYKEAASLTESATEITVLDMEAIQKDILGIQNIN